MPKVQRKFRVLLTLADGRRIYSTEAGKILVVPKGKTETISVKALAWFAYTDDLKAFGLKADLQGPTVGIVAIAFESAHKPLTPGAFVLGGLMATASRETATPERDK